MIVQKMDCLCRHFFVVVVVRKEIHRMSTQRKQRVKFSKGKKVPVTQFGV